MNPTEIAIFIFFAAILSICSYLLGFGRGWLHGQNETGSGSRSVSEKNHPVGETPTPLLRKEGSQEAEPQTKPGKKSKARTAKLERRFGPNMPASEIKIRLKSKGISLSDIDREAGVAVGSASNCILGAGRYHKLREIIAKKIGLEIYEIFPEQPTLPPLSAKKSRELAAVRQQFSRLGHTTQSIARELGLHYPNVSATLNGSSYYPTVAEKIEHNFGIVIPDTRRRKRSKSN